MTPARLPDDESRRLSALAALQVLDSPPEPEFDALVRVASEVLGTPISLISLVDADRQWFKANQGLEGATQTERDLAFCAHAILQDRLLEVTDAAQDPRFADNPLVTGAPGIRFYAGAPLRLSDGSRVGTLCVIDREPRQLSDAQREVLRLLSVAAVRALEGRRALLEERRLREEAATAAEYQARSEARFRALSAASPLGVFATDPQGACTYTNARWQAIYGMTLPESLGDGWASTLHPDDREGVFAAWKQTAHTGAGFDEEFRILQRSGEVRTVRARALPTREDAGGLTGHVGTVEDVTEAVANRTALLAERRRLADILDGTGAGTWEWNIQTGQTRFNARWADIVGRTLEELGPTSIQTWMDLTHPDDRERSGALLQAHFEGRSPGYECEARMRHRDGHWVWVLDRGGVKTWTADGRPEWMFGIQLDITERKRQEEALRKSEALLNRTGEVAGVGGWELDLRTMVPVWSAQTCVIHGMPPDHQPVLDEAIDFYAPEARPVIQAAIEQALAHGQGWDLELPFRQRDGTPIWVRTVGQVEFEGGRPVRLLGALQDVTVRRALHAQLAEKHELLRVTLQSIGDAVITTDASGAVTWLNPVAERMTGWPCEEALGRPVGEVFRIVGEDTRLPAPDPVQACLNQGEAVGLAHHTVLIARDGAEYGIEDSAAPIRNESGETLGVVLVFHDVTEQRRLSGEMTYRATHDGLTGLFNRAEFETRLRRVLQQAQDERSEHVLLMIDLDQFKRVNDDCGHTAGDHLLQQVSRLFSESIRTTDTLARLGGDEFAVILERCPAEPARRVAQQICDRLDGFRFVHEDRRFRVGASIGMVVIDERWSTASAVLQAADASCYAAKEAGRNQVHVWIDSDQSLQARQGEVKWATRLEQALDEDRFVLFAQRIVPLAGEGHDLHAEVLLRMVETSGELVSPGVFLPAAERFGLAARIDRWVLRKTLQVLQGLADAPGIDVLAVNLSGQSIGDRTFHRHALDTLTAAGPAACRRLTLEITETAAITHMADAGAFVDQVRALGVKVVLDDFGAGASSFGYLKHLRVDGIKIDGQFVQGLLGDPLAEPAVRCFVDVARILGVTTVAEFVDRPEVLERVKALGVDHAQGYLVHRPEPLDRLLAARVGPSDAGRALTASPAD